MLKNQDHDSGRTRGKVPDVCKTQGIPWALFKRDFRKFTAYCDDWVLDLGSWIFDISSKSIFPSARVFSRENEGWIRYKFWEGEAQETERVISNSLHRLWWKFSGNRKLSAVSELNWFERHQNSRRLLSHTHDHLQVWVKFSSSSINDQILRVSSKF